MDKHVNHPPSSWRKPLGGRYPRARPKGIAKVPAVRASHPRANASATAHSTSLLSAAANRTARAASGKAPLGSQTDPNPAHLLSSRVLFQSVGPGFESRPAH
jgi:hypothetical protein